VAASCHRIRLPRAPRSSSKLLLASLLGACIVLSVLSTSAHALIITSGSAERYGVQLRAQHFGKEPGEVPLPQEPLQYHGGPVIPNANTYAIYWDPVDAYRSDWMSLIDRYLYNVGADSGMLSDVFSLNSQYTGLAGTRASNQSTFRGAYTDTEPYPLTGRCNRTRGKTVCLTDKQIKEQLKHFVYVNDLPLGIDTIYFVLTPPGVSVCTEETGAQNQCSESIVTREEESTVEAETKEADKSTICGYHSVIDGTSVSPIVYAVQPWTAGNAGSLVSEVPVKTTEPTEPVLNCQNESFLVEPNQTGNRSIFADYETGLADLIVNDLSVEQNNTVVDPLLNGWYGNVGPTPYEAGDVCQHVFNPPPEQIPKAPETTKAVPMSDETINGDPYYLQWGFNSTRVVPNENITCWEATEFKPHFTAPNPVNSGNIVAFDANESDMTLDASQYGFSLLQPEPQAFEEPFTEPFYKWEFGDGMPKVEGIGAAYASVFHSYQYGGTYTVTLTVTDSGGNVGSFSSKVEVNGPPAPGSGSGSTSGTGTGSGTTSTGGTTSPTVSPTGTVTSGVTTGLATPTVYDFFPSHSLTKTLRQGLAVRYAVNEQVAGSMEVMLDSRTAKRLHVRGPLAKGLPKGYPRSIVLRGALLVTTQAGHGTLRVIFPRSMAEKLGHAHRLKLTIRIKVRNADRLHPQTTTLLSTVVLKG
jgi:hypothetical protein